MYVYDEHTNQEAREDHHFFVPHKIMKNLTKVNIIFEAKHSLEEFNKEELSQLKFNVRKKLS